MGITQQEYTQSFAAMQKGVKDELAEQLHKYAEQFQLDELVFPAFIKV